MSFRGSHVRGCWEGVSAGGRATFGVAEPLGSSELAVLGRKTASSAAEIPAAATSKVGFCPVLPCCCPSGAGPRVLPFGSESPAEP